MKILIADDSQTTLLYIEKIIKNNFHNVEVYLANDGKEALEKIKYIKFDLICLDWNMPYYRGYDILIELKRLNLNKNTPTIMITSESGKSEVISAIKADVNDYIIKPFSDRELIFKIEKLIK